MAPEPFEPEPFEPEFEPPLPVVLFDAPELPLEPLLIEPLLFEFFERRPFFVPEVEELPDDDPPEDMLEFPVAEFVPPELVAPPVPEAEPLEPAAEPELP